MIIWKTIKKFFEKFFLILLIFKFFFAILKTTDYLKINWKIGRWWKKFFFNIFWFFPLLTLNFPGTWVAPWQSQKSPSTGPPPSPSSPFQHTMAPESRATAPNRLMWMGLRSSRRWLRWVLQSICWGIRRRFSRSSRTWCKGCWGSGRGELRAPRAANAPVLLFFFEFLDWKKIFFCKLFLIFWSRFFLWFFWINCFFFLNFSSSNFNHFYN